MNTLYICIRWNPARFLESCIFTRNSPKIWFVEEVCSSNHKTTLRKMRHRHDASSFCAAKTKLLTSYRYLCLHIMPITKICFIQYVVLRHLSSYLWHNSYFCKNYEIKIFTLIVDTINYVLKKHSMLYKQKINFVL